MNTGLREAKINVPDESDPSLEGLPVDRAVILVDQQPEDPPAPKHAPAYDNIGRIKGPSPASASAEEAMSFNEGMEVLGDSSRFSQQETYRALEGLRDISHDMYYGLMIVQDPEVLKSLLYVLVAEPAPELGDVPQLTAASILAGALQNNPAALKEVVTAWPDITGTHRPEDSSASLGELYYESLTLPALEKATEDHVTSLATVFKARVSVIKGLIKDDALRADFLQKGGMRKLLQVLVPEGEKWSSVQLKVGQLVLDNFLDADMGAKLGEWPTMAKLSADQCQSTGAVLEEGCWDYHVERIMKANKGDEEHWSRDLHDRLAATRKQGDAPPKHEEL